MSRANVIMLENFGDELERKRLMAKKHTEARDGGRKKKKKRLPPPNMVSDGVIGGSVLDGAEFWMVPASIHTAASSCRSTPPPSCSSLR